LSRYIRLDTSKLAMDAPSDPPIVDLRQALDVRGAPTADGTAFSVDVKTTTGTSHIVVPVADLDRLVSLLLLMGLAPGTARRDIDGDSLADLPLIPPSSLSVGELPNGEALLLIEVGASTLGFSLPPQAATTLGQSLLLAGTSNPATA